MPSPPRHPKVPAQISHQERLRKLEMIPPAAPVSGSSGLTVSNYSVYSWSASGLGSGVPEPAQVILIGDAPTSTGGTPSVSSPGGAGVGSGTLRLGANLYVIGATLTGLTVPSFSAADTDMMRLEMALILGGSSSFAAVGARMGATTFTAQALATGLGHGGLLPGEFLPGDEVLAVGSVGVDCVLAVQLMVWSTTTGAPTLIDLTAAGGSSSGSLVIEDLGPIAVALV